MNRALSSYCDHLGDVLDRVEVTRRSGAPIDGDEAAQEVVALLLEARARGRTVMAVGNGGSAAIAGHLANDLAKSVGVRAQVFTDVSLLTAISNDHGYDVAYEQQVAQWSEPGDVLIAISSSGRSANILRATQCASSRGARVVTLSGFTNDNPLRREGVLNFFAPSKEYGPVELAHSIIAHYWTDLASALGDGASGESHAAQPRSVDLARATSVQRPGGYS